MDAALASVDGAFVGVHFVKIVVRNGKGYIKAGSSTIGANTIAAQLGRSLNDIAEGGSGIRGDQLTILGVSTPPGLGKLLGRGGRAQAYESATDPSTVIKVLHEQPADPRAMITERCRQFSQAEQLGIPTLRETGFLASDGKLYFNQKKTSPVNFHDPNFKAIYDAAREKLKCSTIFIDVDNPNNWGALGGQYYLIDP